MKKENKMSETMKAIKCELCGSNELVKQDDYFVCQFCGTKHEKRYNSDTIQIMFGDAEKDRLLKNAVAFQKLGNNEQSCRVYDRIISEYPEAIEAYIGKCRVLIETLNIIYSKSDYEKYVNSNNVAFYNFSLDISLSTYKSILNIENAVRILTGNDATQIKHLWENYEKEHSCFVINYIKDVKNGVVVFEKDYLSCYPFFPSFFEQIFDLANQNAQLLKKEMCKKGISIADLNALLKDKIEYKKVDVDGFIVPEEVVDIKYFTPRALILDVVGQYCNDTPKKFDYVIRYLNNNDSIEKATNEIISLCNKGVESISTQKIDFVSLEKKCTEILSLLQGFGDSFALLKEMGTFFESSYYSNYDYAFVKYERVDIYEHYVEFVISMERRATLSKQSAYDKHFYPDKNKPHYEQHNKRVVKSKIDDILHFLRNRKSTTCCQYCGGDFRGILKKTCKKCFKEKDY